METIVIATIKEWNISNFFALQEKYKDKYNFILIKDEDKLTFDYLNKITPKYVFFPHWSWIVPKNIYNNFECIVFHMTDLPFGRGGSPLQNLLQRKIYQTKISAIKVEDGLDTGDIYLKEDFDISKGSAHELYLKASKIIFEKMIPFLLENSILPKKQNGKATIFQRRIQRESNIFHSQFKDIRQIYDFIRMLDAPSYPKAYLDMGEFRVEFKNAKLKNGKLSGNFEVKTND
ncbi:MAG TPA: methionyl-tRNA formyltransferase [Sulfurospirillum sp. UBA12182]|nr:MAG TPA: methionyl-tRNA formyltransferase [Sulfurospirillum sp. UBA12182]